MENEARKIELSGKLLQMGRSLIDEGKNLDDYTISQSGSIMIFIGSLLLSDEDMFIFSEICAMFSAKKILEATDDIDNTDAVKKYIKGVKNKRNKNRGGDTKGE